MQLILPARGLRFVQCCFVATQCVVEKRVSVLSEGEHETLTARDRILLDHCVALTCEPDERKQDDIERVSEYGFDDGAILKATAIASFYNLINRLVLALGVALEDGLQPWEFGRQK